jgi:hypothetical protein
MSPASILATSFLAMKARAAAMTNKAIHKDYRPNGICSQFDDFVSALDVSFSEKMDARKLFHEIMEGPGGDWPGHSGCYVYPVPYSDEAELREMWSKLSPESQEVYAALDSFEEDAPEAQPVPFEKCPKGGLAELAFDYLPQKYFWDANHPYGKARLEFLDFLIEIINERI